MSDGPHNFEDAKWSLYGRHFLPEEAKELKNIIDRQTTVDQEDTILGFPDKTEIEFGSFQPYLTWKIKVREAEL